MCLTPGPVLFRLDRGTSPHPLDRTDHLFRTIRLWDGHGLPERFQLPHRFLPPLRGVCAGCELGSPIAVRCGVSESALIGADRPGSRFS